MKAHKRRELRPDEVAAQKRYKDDKGNPMTRRAWNAQYGRFAGLEASRQRQFDVGNFFVVAIFDGDLGKTHTNNYPAREAALANVRKLMTNPSLRAVTLSQTVAVRNGDIVENRSVPCISFRREAPGGFQGFANSEREPVWQQPGTSVQYTESAIRKNPHLADGGLEFVRYNYSKGEAWWETHKERKGHDKRP